MNEEWEMELWNKLEDIPYSTKPVQNRTLPQELGSSNPCRALLQAKGLTNQGMMQPQGLGTTKQNQVALELTNRAQFKSTVSFQFLFDTQDKTRNTFKLHHNSTT